MFTYQPKKLRHPRLVALGVVAILATIGLLCYYGPQVYDRWQVHRLMQQAQTKMVAGQFRESIAPLIKVLQINPKHVIACRMVAEAIEKLGSPESIQFRERVLGILPDSLEDAVKFTDTSLRFENVDKARAGMDLIRKNKAAPPALLPPLLARLAMLKGDNREAETQFSEMLRREPRNLDYLVSLASLQIESPKAELRDAARKVLADVRSNPKYRLAAMRGLLKDAIRQNDSTSAYSQADDLVIEKGNTFQDRLLRLTLLQKTKDSFFTAYLGTLQKEATTGYKTMDQMLQWIARNDAASDSQAWIDQIPIQYLTKPPLAKSMADVFVKMPDWQSLADLTLGENWEDSDYLRMAYLSIAQFHLGRKELATQTWNASVQQASGRLDPLKNLLALAEAQDWDDERIHLLWQVADLSTQPVEIWQTLLEYHLQHGQTALAYQACTHLLESGIDDQKLTENWLQLSLILNQNLAKALPMAVKNYQQNPDSPEAATVLALGYIRQKRIAEAYFLLRNLPPEQLEKPYVATYYGITCAALGLLDAGRYLNLGMGARLFPEEYNLVRQARQKINQDWLSHLATPAEIVEPGPLATSGN